MSSQNVMATNTSFLDTDKRVLFNINWDLASGGVRQLEIDAFKCLNSNVNNTSTSTVLSPIDGTNPKTDVTLFLARTRLIKLIDIWNRILNSGLFSMVTHTNGTSVVDLKLVGSNFRSIIEYPFRNLTGSFSNTLDFSTTFIFSKIIPFITASVNNLNWFKTNSVGKQSYFALTTIGSTKEFSSFINVNYNPDNATFIGLMNELIAIVKDLLDETKLASALSFNFASLDFGTAQGRANLLALDAYKSNYKAIAKIDISYLNADTKVLAQGWIDTNSSKVPLLYPQFGTLISRNTENEAWSFRNIVVDTSSYNPLDLNPTLGDNKPYQTKYWVGSQLDMKRPLVFEPQFINWSNSNDRPYVMLYNGGTLINIPDEIKNSIYPNTLGTFQEAPDNQLNLSAYFWKIGTSNGMDPNFDNEADIKLKIPDSSSTLYSIDKLDFLDNLTIYLKLN